MKNNFSPICVASVREIYQRIYYANVVHFFEKGDK